MPSPLTRLMSNSKTKQYQLFSDVSVTTQPAEEPVTLAQAKLHCRVDTSDEDTLITALIVSARQLVESYCKRSLISQTRKLTLNGFPGCDFIELPYGPVASVTSVTSYNSDNDDAVFSTDAYKLGADKIYLNDGYTWPSSLRDHDSCEIVYVAGRANADSLEQEFKQAVLMIVGHWYENRETVAVGTIAPEMPMTAAAILNSYVDRKL